MEFLARHIRAKGKVILTDIWVTSKPLVKKRFKFIIRLGGQVDTEEVTVSMKPLFLWTWGNSHVSASFGPLNSFMAPRHLGESLHLYFCICLSDDMHCCHLPPNKDSMKKYLACKGRVINFQRLTLKKNQNTVVTELSSQAYRISDTRKSLGVIWAGLYFEGSLRAQEGHWKSRVKASC